MDVFKGVDKQYIDENGKLRGVVFSDGLAMFTNPLPPLDVEEMDSMENSRVPLKIVLKFIQDKSLKIVSQEVEKELSTGNNVIVGLHVSDDNFYGFIQVEYTYPIKDIPHTSIMDINLIQKKTISKLELMKNSQIVGNYLKEYTFYTYAKSPEKFGENSFIVDSTHKYNLSNLPDFFSNEQTTFYKNGKIIVLSDEMRDNLTYYLKIQLMNDPSKIEKYKKVNSFFKKNVDQYKESPTQLILNGINNLQKWVDQNKRIEYEMSLRTDLVSTIKTPYFYQTVNFHGKNIVMIQNVKTGENDFNNSIKRALTVAVKWEKDNVNNGYNSYILKNVLDRVDYEIYDENLTMIARKESPTKDKYLDEIVRIIQYKTKNFGALLFF